MKKDKFYLTTSIVYTNNPPHIGFAFELTQADVIARYYRLLKKDVYFLTGTDEHGLKIQKRAEEENKNYQDFTNEISKQVKELIKKLEISNNGFIRTTDRKKHIPLVRKIWQELEKKGLLYKKRYKGYYCPGCEVFLLEKDLVDKKCPIHKKECRLEEEENYFFRLSFFSKKILDLLNKDKIKIFPKERKKEIISLLKKGLKDISFSRSREKVKWGIEVPTDPSQTIYVWLDALLNYLSGLEYLTNREKFNFYWPPDIQCIGKDILKFHAIYWPAILLSLSLPLPKAFFVHGFLTINGEKISKSLGNVIDPLYLIEKYSSSALRYYFIREIPTFFDGDFSEEKLINRYNSELAYGLGNLISRSFTLLSGLKKEIVLKNQRTALLNFTKKQILKFHQLMKNYKLNEAYNALWEIVKENNRYLNTYKPWEKDRREKEKILIPQLTSLVYLMKWLFPLLPSKTNSFFKFLNLDILKEKEWFQKKIKIKKIEYLFPYIHQTIKK